MKGIGRSERHEGIGLTLVFAVFMLGALPMVFVAGEVLFGVLAFLFFGGGGILLLVRALGDR